MKNELQPLQLFSPLFPHIYRKNAWGELDDYREDLSAGEILEYEDKILALIQKEKLPSESERGLAVYLDDILTYPLNTNGLMRISDITQGKRSMKTARKCSVTSRPVVPRKRLSLRLRFAMWIWPMRATFTTKKPANTNVIIQMSRCH